MESQYGVYITTNVYDESNISYVRADIRNKEGTLLVSLNLYDDGEHGDDDANDSIYGTSWEANIQNNFTVDISASDIFGNAVTVINASRFSTNHYTSHNKILLVDNYGPNWNDYSSYFNTALNYRELRITPQPQVIY
jgi:hypothetical protein